MNRYEVYELVKAERGHIARDIRIKNDILEMICFAFNVKLSDLSNCTRRHKIVVPRQLAGHFISKYTRLPLRVIGDIFNRDHSTITNTNHVVDNLIFSDKRYRLQYYALDKEIQETIVKVEKVINTSLTGY